MTRLHHVNLGVLPEAVDEERSFLGAVLGYRELDLSDELRALGAIWFEDEHGQQIHLSVDPDHRPAGRAHVALELGPDAAAVEARLTESGRAVRVVENDGLRIVLCQDPAGNRWELRSPAA